MYGHMLQLQLPSPPGRADERLVRRRLLHLVDDVRLGRDDDRLAGECQREIEDRLGRADMVGMVDDVRRAFGMRGDRRAGMLRLELQQLGLAEGLVDDAHARPQQHVAAGLAREIAAEVPVGPEDDLLVLRDLVEDDLGADELVTMMSESAFTAAEQLM